MWYKYKLMLASILSGQLELTDVLDSTDRLLDMSKTPQ